MATPLEHFQKMRDEYLTRVATGQYPADIDFFQAKIDLLNSYVGLCASQLATATADNVQALVDLTAATAAKTAATTNAANKVIELDTKVGARVNGVVGTAPVGTRTYWQDRVDTFVPTGGGTNATADEIAERNASRLLRTHYAV